MDRSRDADDEGSVMPIQAHAYAHGMRRCIACWVAFNNVSDHLFERGHMPIPLVQAAGGRS